MECKYHKDMGKIMCNGFTAYNRTVNASPPSAARVPQNTSRANALLRGFQEFDIYNQLCEIRAKLVQNTSKNGLYNI